MKTPNCIFWTTFWQSCHFMRCAWLQQQQPLRSAHPPSAANLEILVAPTAAGDLGWCRSEGLAPLDPCLASPILFQKKYAPAIPFFWKQCNTTIQNCLPEVLACKKILGQGLKGFYLLVILSTINVPYSSYCINPWCNVKHLIFQETTCILRPTLMQLTKWGFWCALC